MKKNGFTLVDFLIGLAIILILATIPFYLIKQVKQGVKVATVRSQLAKLSVRIEAIKKDTGYYPSQKDNLSLPADPWGKDYFYIVHPGPVFGPGQFLRGECGPPHGKTFYFSAVPGDAKLVVENTYKIVHAGTVWLNGAEIVSPDEFKDDIPLIEKDVTLLAYNSLRIRLTSNPASYIFLTIFSNTSKQTHYILGSYGVDKKGGGTGFNADIVWAEGGFS